MKVEIEFELLKDEPKIEALIAGRVYALDCVDKPKDVKARVVGFRTITVDVLANVIRTADGTNSLGAGALAEKIFQELFADEADSLEWPTLITLPVRHMPEEVKP